MAALALHADMACRHVWIVHRKGKGAQLGDTAIRAALRTRGYVDTKEDHRVDGSLRRFPFGQDVAVVGVEGCGEAARCHLSAVDDEAAYVFPTAGPVAALEHRLKTALGQRLPLLSR